MTPPTETWVFDLDNTLYPASCDLFSQIDQRMGAFLAEMFACDRVEARRIQKDYFHRYGTTLRGLMLHHRVDPDTFLDFVHEIDHRPVPPDPALDRALAALQGRKIVFTNGSQAHAEKVLDRLGIARHFEGIFDIRAADYLPKPEIETYRRLIGRHGFDPRTAAMFEDLARNLEPAAALGMRTVLVTADPAENPPAYVHHVTHDLAAWLAAAGRK